MLEQGLLVTAGVAFLISVALSPLFIPFLRKLKFGQSIRDDGPKSHQKKSGTPTMGGIVIYVSMMVTSLIMAIKFNYLGAEVSLLLLVTFGYGLIGFLDDYIKVVKLTAFDPPISINSTSTKYAQPNSNLTSVPGIMMYVWNACPFPIKKNAIAITS